MSGPRKKRDSGRPAPRVVHARRAESPVVDELGLPEVAEGEQLAWRPVEYLDALLAVTELDVLCAKPFDAMTLDELEQVSRCAFTISFAVIEERQRRGIERSYS